MAAIADAVAGPVKSPTNIQIAWLMFAAALLFAAAKPILPDGLIRLPEWALLPWQKWMQSLFDFIREDLGLIYVTRGIASGLEVLLDATANILYGKHRWPRIGPAPWAAVAGVAAVLGYCASLFLRAGHSYGRPSWGNGSSRWKRCRSSWLPRRSRSWSVWVSAFSPGSTEASKKRCGRCWLCFRRFRFSPTFCPPSSFSKSARPRPRWRPSSLPFRQW